ncbi:START domain containing 7 protein [Wuchereria bancrofti]|nr:START domain containing 7 protein [Wuchereria bancrofti]
MAEAKTNTNNDFEDWEVVRNEGNSKVLRRLHAGTGLYEFRCSGSYDDITASDFVDAQMDLAFRKKWDPNVEKLELVRKDDNTDSELIHWVAKFPYPMYPREYVFVRRRYIDEKDHCIVIANCAVADSANIIPRCEKKYVRVETYRSIMVVRAHKTFDCKGFDYVLSYYDNPESNIPKYAYNWLVNYGGPYYLRQVHDAAKKLEQQRIEKSINNAETIKAKKPTAEVSSKSSNDEGNSEQKVDSPDLSKMTGKEPESTEEDAETLDTADLEFEMLSPPDIRLYDRKPISSLLDEYFVFVD